MHERSSRILALVSPAQRAALESAIARIVERARAQIARFDRERAEEGDEAVIPGEAQWRRYGGDADPWICFLVSRDGASIEAHPWNFPFGSLWNGYSPFREIPELTVSSLAELRTLALPPDLAKDP